MATLTFVYAESTAVIGPLAGADEPHSWDLCSEHADRITVPVGWQMLRSESEFVQPAEDSELTALAEAVREGGTGSSALAPANLRPKPGFSPHADGDDALPGRHRADRRSSGQPLPGLAGSPAAGPRPGRRGHLRVLPDPVD